MAEYLIQDTTLTNLGDKIRVLSGTEDAMTPAAMASNVDEANTEVDTQADLIAQIMEILNNKYLDGVNYASYLEPISNAYINTEYAPNTNTKIIAEVEVTSIPSTTSFFFGCREASGSGRFSAMCITNKFGLGYGTQIVYEQDMTTGQHTIEIDNNVMTVDGVVVASANAESFQNTRTMYIFAENNAGALAHYFKYRLISLKIYEGDVLQRHYRPCFDEEGVACAREKVSGTYVYTAGSGSFNAGIIEKEV